MQETKQAFINEEMTVGDVILKWPEVAEIFGKYGLSCIGCSVNTMEAVGVGARGHGMTEENIQSMLKEANDFVAKKTGDGHEEDETLPSTGQIKLTEAGAKKVLDLMKSQNKANSFLRFGVAAGGCSGLSYQMEFTEAKNGDDILLEEKGVKILVSPKSMKKVDGVQIDFVDGLQGSGFKITNPNAHSGCGCGKSFS